jgi:hypothetical protein
MVVPARLKRVRTVLDGLDPKGKLKAEQCKQESSVEQHLASDVPADVDRSTADPTEDRSRREPVVPDEQYPSQLTSR